MAAIARYITIIFTVGRLQIFKAGYFFPQKRCHGAYRNHKLWLYFPSQTYQHHHGRPQEFFQGGKADIVLIFFSLLAMQRKWTYTKNVQCYGNSYIQCLPNRNILHWENVCFSENGYFKTELAEFLTNYKLCEWNEYKILSKYEQNAYLIQIASPCFHVFPMFWKVASAREWFLCANGLVVLRSFAL